MMRYKVWYWIDEKIYYECETLEEAEKKAKYYEELGFSTRIEKVDFPLF